MSITDELREYSIKFAPNTKILGIADRIDAEHQKAIRELNNLADASVLLPVDADGEYIHIGDVLQWPEDGDTFEVIGIGDDGVLFYLDPDTEGETADWTASQNKRHYREPTVEDVLREMADRIYADEGEPRDRDAIVAEFAAKLELREASE